MNAFFQALAIFVSSCPNPPVASLLQVILEAAQVNSRGLPVTYVEHLLAAPEVAGRSLEQWNLATQVLALEKCSVEDFNFLNLKYDEGCRSWRLIISRAGELAALGYFQHNWRDKGERAGLLLPISREVFESELATRSGSLIFTRQILSHIAPLLHPVPAKS